ncbi:MAG: DUF2958 domain-containing protein [Blastocatellia bacterium]|nr:DUF2958 domain-containing protein [Blastocatellia bacterium]
MSRLLHSALRSTLPKLREQQHSKDPMVYAVFYFPLSGWKWFVTEGAANGDDFLFFGYVIGFEAELGYFSWSELKSVNIDGIRVESVENFEPAVLSDCVSRFTSNE